MARWLWLLLALVVSTAGAGRLTTFTWDAGSNWPAGTTVELCGNGDVCLSGLTGTQATLDLLVQPGEVIQGRARAVTPAGYQCGVPPVPCPYSEWATVVQTWPAPPIGGLARYEEQKPMAIEYGGHTSVGNSDLESIDFTGPSITGLNTYLLVGVGIDGGQGEIEPTSVTYDGVAMTSLGTIRGGNYCRVAVYGVINPGSAKTVSIQGTLARSATFAVYYTGVNQTTPTRTATTGGGSSTPATLAVTNSAVNDLIVGFFVTNDTSLVNSFTEARIGSGQTYRDSIVNSSLEALIAFGEEAGASGTVTHSWAYAGSEAWSALAVPLIPVEASATALPRRALDGPFYGSLRGSVR